MWQALDQAPKCRSYAVDLKFAGKNALLYLVCWWKNSCTWSKGLYLAIPGPGIWHWSTFILLAVFEKMLSVWHALSTCEVIFSKTHVVLSNPFDTHTENAPKCYETACSACTYVRTKILSEKMLSVWRGLGARLNLLSALTNECLLLQRMHPSCTFFNQRQMQRQAKTNTKISKKTKTKTNECLLLQGMQLHTVLTSAALLTQLILSVHNKTCAMSPSILPNPDILTGSFTGYKVSCNCI